MRELTSGSSSNWVKDELFKEAQMTVSLGLVPTDTLYMFGAWAFTPLMIPSNWVVLILGSRTMRYFAEVALAEAAVECDATDFEAVFQVLEWFDEDLVETVNDLLTISVWVPN